MSRVFTAQIRVRSYELDSFGHVNNATYLQYLEAARCDHLRQVGLSFNDFQKWGAFPVVLEAHLRYHHPLIADDVIEVRGTFVDWKRSSFAVEYEVVKQDGTLVLTARMVFVFVNGQGKPIRVPEEFREAFTR
ncbi:MAG: acyl-CoA thioesterase [Abditibacteriales bacterium]|nr:acyl-CoA thioesterase [Abditibacteriales bacterium]MDW8366789.1 thioesterase family protein [Abditibacteriales bacterium]